jgi:TolA-binding protein
MESRYASKRAVLAAWVLSILPLMPGLGAAEGDLDVWVSEGRWPRGKNAVEPTPAKQLKKAKRLEAVGDVRQAAEQFRRLADVFTESDEAEEALILSARNYLAAGSYTKCRKQLAELRRRYIHPSYLDLLGQVEVSLGRGYLEGKGEGGTYRVSSRVRKARQIFKQVIKEDPQGRWADDAVLGLGRCEETLGHYNDAIKHYKELLQKYPRSELRAEAEGRIAFFINAREPRPEYTETDTSEARRRIQAARTEAAGGDANLDLVALDENEKLLEDRQAQKRYEQAQFYAKNGRYRAAEVYYELVKLRYPKSKWAKEAEKALKKMRQR